MASMVDVRGLVGNFIAVRFSVENAFGEAAKNLENDEARSGIYIHSQEPEPIEEIKKSIAEAKGERDKVTAKENVQKAEENVQKEKIEDIKKRVK